MATDSDIFRPSVKNPLMQKNSGNDAFVAEPLAYLELLEQKLALPSGCLEPWAEKVSPGQRDILDTVQAAVSDEARELHQQLRARAINPEQNAPG